MKKTAQVYTIFRSPKDYPNYYVARRFDIFEDGKLTPSKEVHFGKSLEEVRFKLINIKSLMRIERDPADHHSVIETWV